MVPRPWRPSTPLLCASSTIMMAPYFSAAAHRPGSGPISPSMLKTPSLMSSFFRQLGHPGQLLFGVGHILVAEDQNLGAREAAAIDDAGVVQLVADDVVILAEDG